MKNINTFSSSHFLFIYKRRKEGWEAGQVKYPQSLYEQVSLLVKNLEVLPETSQCWIESTSTGTTFYADGKEIGKVTDPN